MAKCFSSGDGSDGLNRSDTQKDHKLLEKVSTSQRACVARNGGLARGLPQPKCQIGKAAERRKRLAYDRSDTLRDVTVQCPMKTRAKAAACVWHGQSSSCPCPSTARRARADTALPVPHNGQSARHGLHRGLNGYPATNFARFFYFSIALWLLRCINPIGQVGNDV